MQEHIGNIRHPAGEDLTDKEGYLVVLTHDAGVAEVKLPAAQSAVCPYVVKYGDVDTAECDLTPLSPDRVLGIKLKGTCNPGALLVLADETTAADKGKVRTVPAPAVAEATYTVHAIAEEKGVDGQILRARPIGPYTVTVAAL